MNLYTGDQMNRMQINRSMFAPKAALNFLNTLNVLNI